ncbi:fungal specific transcription factor domain-containing protein [Candidatus Bathyarchaeota archaeon]|nr:fungal specific transcription factor domain-containing protein [Candidatus Bathyarchaeota archaeon]
MTQCLQGTESSVQTWNIHGLAVKASYQLGLHSKHALERYEPLEREMRTRAWYTCVVLDRYVLMR